MPGPVSYARIADQLKDYAKEVLPDFVRELQDKIQKPGVDPIIKAPQTHLQKMAQSDRGHQNPGPGKKKVKPW